MTIRLKTIYLALLMAATVQVSAQKQSIKILHTSDEHGWFMPSEYNSGAAALYAEWQNMPDFSHENYLILSGGDNWTGTALSTWSYGKPMTQIMTTMGYDASALGNHEFDFGRDTLKLRMQEAGYPYLAANVVYKNNGQVPEFIQPYVIVEHQGLQIGLLGLANVGTPTSTMPEHVADLDFTDYTQAIDKYVPLMRQQGAKVILLLTHSCSDEAREYLPTADKWGIPLITTGHCHQEKIIMDDRVLIVESGSYMSYYTYVEFEYDHQTEQTSLVGVERMGNRDDESNVDIAAIATHWDSLAAETLKKQVGYTVEDIKRQSPAMQNMICDAWLEVIPGAHAAFSNNGGVRQDIFAGQITVETLLGLLPFNNKIIKLKLTGKQLTEVIRNNKDWFIGGFTMRDKIEFLDGTPVQDNKVYVVLTSDYLYTVDENLQQYDPNPEYTTYTYRDPVELWLKSLETTPDNPLSKYLDDKTRLEK